MGAISHSAHLRLPRHALRLGTALLTGDRQPATERKVVKAAKAFNPDILLGLTSQLHCETMADLRKLCPGRLVLWWGDAPANSRRWGLLDPAWDLTFIKDSHAVQKLRLLGRNAFHLHEAMNPIWHKPVATQTHERLAVAGNYYAFRQAVILRLLHDGVQCDLYGPPAPRWSHKTVLDRHTGQYVTREQKSRVFGQALGCLNTFSLAEGDSLNCRAFEIAGAGGLQFIEYRRAIDECFDAGKELLTFSEYEELADHIARATRDPKEAARIRDAGARRALAEHTYAHRLKRILDYVEGRA